MKKLITFALLMGSILNGYSQADNHLYGPVPYRTMQETIGETFIVLPLKKNDDKYIMLQQNNGDNLSPKTAGKLLKLIDIDITKHYAHFKDNMDVEYKCQISENSFYELVPLKDFEVAQKLFLNKILWLNSNKIYVGDPLDNKGKKILRIFVLNQLRLLLSIYQLLQTNPFNLYLKPRKVKWVI